MEGFHECNNYEEKSCFYRRRINLADYNDMEMMIVVAARELKNGATVGVGTGKD